MIKVIGEKVLGGLKSLKKKENIFKLLIVASLFIKTILFMAILSSDNADEMIMCYVNYKYIIFYIPFILLFFSIGYLLSKNKRMIYLISINIIYSIIILLDLWFYRMNGSFYSLKHILFSGTFNIYDENVIKFMLMDIVFIIDILLIIGWIIIKKVRINEKRNIKKFVIGISLSMVMMVTYYIFIERFRVTIDDFYISDSVQAQDDHILAMNVLGPIGYQVVDSRDALYKARRKVNSEEDQRIKDWFEYNDEKLPDNEYMGKAKGKNVIFLQLESFENFIINEKANGKELTPFLNKLIKKSIYFNNIYEQNNRGLSIDCDYMVNSSLYPLGDNITAVRYAQNYYPEALPRLVSQKGYETISSHPESKNNFNWSELHRHSFGVNKLWRVNDYVYEEKVGYGLSDKSFLSQIAEKIKHENAPFFLQMVTESSHGPFDLPQKYRELDLPEEIDKDHLGGYFQSVHYTDKQVEMFFDKLEEYGVLDNTVVVIYGDHSGVHRYYNDDIQKLDYEDNFWKPFDHKIPLIIYGLDCDSKIIENAGGQTDIPPTVAYLLGIDKDLYKDKYMGRNLLNTKRDATVIKGKVIKGKPKDEEEEKHLKDAYDIGGLIIRNNYFND